MRPTSSQRGHSAEVKIHLLLRGQTIPVVQMGPDFLLVDAARDQAPGDASLVLKVDASERTWHVRLPDGISGTSRRVAIASAA
jgi:hypothetical protein